MAALDYYGRPIQAGDVVRAMAADPRGGLPLYATNLDLTVVAVRRTRVEVACLSAFNGTLTPPADHLKIVWRDGLAFDSAAFGEGDNPAWDEESPYWVAPTADGHWTVRWRDSPNPAALFNGNDFNDAKRRCEEIRNLLNAAAHGPRSGKWRTATRGE